MRRSKKPKVSSKPFDAKDAGDIDAIAAAGMRTLGLKPSATAEAKVKRITKEIDDHLFKKKRKSKGGLLELASQMGCLYGNILRDEVGWEWCIVNDDGDEFLGIGPSDKSAILAPVAYVHTQMTAPLSGDNTSMPLFNMIKGDGGRIPEGKPGKYVAIG